MLSNMASVEIFKENLWPSCLPFENVANIDCGTFTEESNDYFTSDVRSHYSALSGGTSHNEAEWSSVCAMFTTSDPCCFDSDLSKPTFLCNFCNFDADALFAVFDHVIKEHAFSCKLCNYTCFTKSGMVHHQLVFHESSQTMKGLLASTFIHLNLDKIQEKLHDKTEHSEDAGSGTNSMEDYFTDSSNLRMRVYDIKQEPSDYMEDAHFSGTEGKDDGAGGVRNNHGFLNFRRSLSTQSQNASEAGCSNNMTQSSLKDEAGEIKTNNHEHFLNLSSSNEIPVAAVEPLNENNSDPVLHSTAGQLQSFLTPTPSSKRQVAEGKNVPAYPLLQEILQKDKQEQDPRTERQLSKDHVSSVSAYFCPENIANESKKISSPGENEAGTLIEPDKEKNVWDSLTVQVKEENRKELAETDSQCADDLPVSFSPTNDKDSANFTLLRTLLQKQTEANDAKSDQSQSSNPEPVSDQHDESSTSPVHVADMTLEQLLTCDFSRKRTYSQLMGKGKDQSNAIVLVCGDCSFESRDKVSFKAHLSTCSKNESHETSTIEDTSDESKRMKYTHSSHVAEAGPSSKRRKSARLPQMVKSGSGQSGLPRGRGSESSSLSEDSEFAVNSRKDSLDADWQLDPMSSSSSRADSSDDDFLPNKGQRKIVRKSQKGSKQLRHKSKGKSRPPEVTHIESSYFLSCSHCAFSSKVLSAARHHLISNHLTLPPMAKVVAHGVPRSMMYFCRGLDNQCPFVSNKVEEIHGHIRLCYKDCLVGHIFKGNGKDYTPVLASFAIAAKGGENKEAMYYCMDCDYSSGAFQSISSHRENSHRLTMTGVLHIEKGIREIRMTMRCLSCLEFISVQKWWTHPCRLKKGSYRKQASNVLVDTSVSTPAVCAGSPDPEHCNPQFVPKVNNSQTDSVKIKNEVILIDDEGDETSSPMASSSVSGIHPGNSVNNDQSKVIQDKVKNSFPLINTLLDKRKGNEGKQDTSGVVRSSASKSTITNGSGEKEGSTSQPQSASSPGDSPPHMVNQWELDAFRKAFSQLSSDSDRLIASILRKTHSQSEQTGILQSILTSPLTTSVNPHLGSSSNDMTLLKGLLHKSAASTKPSTSSSLQAASTTTTVMPSSTNVSDIVATSTGNSHAASASHSDTRHNIPRAAKPLQPSISKDTEKDSTAKDLSVTKEVKPEPVDMELMDVNPSAAASHSSQAGSSHTHERSSSSQMQSSSSSSERDLQLQNNSDQALYQVLMNTMKNRDSVAQADPYPSTNLLRSLLTKQSKD